MSESKKPNRLMSEENPTFSTGKGAESPNFGPSFLFGGRKEVRSLLEGDEMEVLMEMGFSPDLKNELLDDRSINRLAMESGLLKMSLSKKVPKA